MLCVNFQDEEMRVYEDRIPMIERRGRVRVIVLVSASAFTTGIESFDD